MAEFALVTVMLMTLFLALLSLALWAYSRVLLTSAAAEAARYVANYDVSDQVAAQRAQDTMAAGLASGTASTIACTTDVQGRLVGVRCTMSAPGVFGFLDGVMPDISVTGHSVKEQP